MSDLGTISCMGYRHPLYAISLKSWGKALEMSMSRGTVLDRRIPNTNYCDLTNCYPFFCCDNWAKLNEDIATLNNDAVSICLVTDPFANLTIDKLDRIFPDACYLFKKHFVANLGRPASFVVSTEVRRKALKALRAVEVELCASPLDWLDEWCQVYDNLVRRHRITGPTRFSREIFAIQLSVPGAVLFRAIAGQRTVALSLWYEVGEIAYYHLGAARPEGYQLSAAYAIFWSAWEYFSSRATRLNGRGPRHNPSEKRVDLV